MTDGGGTRVARVTYLGAFAVSMLGAAFAFPYLGLHLSSGGASGAHTYAVGIGLSAATGLIANPFAARLARRWGPMTVFACGVLLQGGGLAVLESTQATLVGVLAGFGINGLGSGAAFGTATAALADHFGRQRLSGIFSAQGLLANVAAGVAGAAASVIVAAVGADAYGAFVWIACAGYLILATVLFALAARMTGDRVETRGGRVPRIGSFAGLRDRRFRVVLMVQVLVAGLVMAQLNRVYALAWTADGVDPALVGILFAINAGGVVALQVPALRISRAVEPRRMLMIAAVAVLASVATVAVVIETAPFVVAVVGVVLLAGAEVCINSSLQPLVVASSPPGAVIEYAANASLAYSFALIVAPALGIALLSLAPWVYWTCSIGVALVLLVLTTRLPKVEVRSHA